MKKALPGSGFTIIEVMIVLAIAGLIMLVVFLAVPALQRSSRNNERKHDVALLSVQRQQYDQDNGTTVAAATATCESGDTTSFGNFCDYITSGMAYYTPDEVTIIDNGYDKPTSLPTVTPDQLITETYLHCNDTLTDATTDNAGPYDAVVLYALEAPGGKQINQCMESGVVSGGGG